MARRTQLRSPKDYYRQKANILVILPVITGISIIKSAKKFPKADAPPDRYYHYGYRSAVVIFANNTCYRIRSTTSGKITVTVADSTINICRLFFVFIINKNTGIVK